MPADAPVISAVSATNRSLFRIGCRWSCRFGCEHRWDDHGYADVRGTDPLLGGGVPLGPWDALLSRPAAGARGGQPGADAIPARPRPDRALEGVPAAQAQDAGVRGAGGRSLPDPAHAHPRGLLHLADGGAGARPERGPDGGDRAGP